MFETPRQRARQLTTKFAASPVLPMLGWTKVVETIVANGPTANWIGYAGIVTLIWVYADEIQRRADDLQNAAEDAVDG